MNLFIIVGIIVVAVIVADYLGMHFA